MICGISKSKKSEDTFKELVRHYNRGLMLVSGMHPVMILMLIKIGVLRLDIQKVHGDSESFDLLKYSTDKISMGNKKYRRNNSIIDIVIDKDDTTMYCVYIDGELKYKYSRIGPKIISFQDGVDIIYNLKESIETSIGKKITYERTLTYSNGSNTIDSGIIHIVGSISGSVMFSEIGSGFIFIETIGNLISVRGDYGKFTYLKG